MGHGASGPERRFADNTGTAVSPQDIPFGPTLAKTPFFIEFVNSIVAGTFAGACGPSTSSVPYAGHTNLQYPGSSCGATFASANPYLGSYYVPFFWSPALGAGDNAVCDATPINHKDVYSVRRPLGRDGCAIGAVEGDIRHLIHRWLAPECCRRLNP